MININRLKVFKRQLIVTIISLVFVQSIAAETAIERAVMRLIESRACPQCELQGADLSGKNLVGVNLIGADLTAANLDGTNLRGANMQGVILLQVNLVDTMLAGANLREADLSDLDIDEVFESVEIIGTQFEGAKFKYGVVCGPPPNKGGWGCQQL